MKSIKTSAAAVSVISIAMTGLVLAQGKPPQAWNGPMMGQWAPRNNSDSGFMGPGMMGYVGMGPWMMGQGGPSTAMCSIMANHIEGRLAYIKTELKITQPQDPLWDAYAAAARDSGGTMLARCATMASRAAGSSISVPERLDQNEQLLTAQLDAVRAMNKALKPLYEALTDGQKQRADQILLGPMGMM
jgi:LTXXQ motif family protein